MSKIKEFKDGWLTEGGYTKFKIICAILSVILLIGEVLYLCSNHRKNKRLEKKYAKIANNEVED